MESCLIAHLRNNQGHRVCCHVPNSLLNTQRVLFSILPATNTAMFIFSSLFDNWRNRSWEKWWAPWFSWGSEFSVAGLHNLLPLNHSISLPDLTLKVGSILYLQLPYSFGQPLSYIWFSLVCFCNQHTFSRAPPRPRPTLYFLVGEAWGAFRKWMLFFSPYDDKRGMGCKEKFLQQSPCPPSGQGWDGSVRLQRILCRSLSSEWWQQLSDAAPQLWQLEADTQSFQ